jgi:uncharacterized NAD(P)/FAD-binding protein YdhS
MSGVTANPYRVVVVGAGVSGSLTAIGLLRRWKAARPLRLTLVERSGDYGRGVAYATPDDRHLLNVAACGMSAFPVETDHFLEWVRGHGHEIDDRAFVRRKAFGDYIAHQLDLAQAGAGPGVVERRDAEAIAVAPGLNTLSVRLAGGEALAADVVVMATGVSQPAPVPGARDDLPGYLADPWDHARLTALRRASRVLIVGTGLTMVDVALTLGSEETGPLLTAVSRTGLMPRAHVADACDVIAPVVRPEDGPWDADALAATVGAAAERCPDWRAVVDSLRPVTQALWRALPLEEKRRFAARHGRLWEVHRHRMAPAVAEGIDAQLATGRLAVRAGSVRVVGAIDRGVAVELDGRRERFDAVVNATGPDLNVRRAGQPVLRSLLDGGLATPGPLDLGFATDADGRCADPRVFAIGALRRGELWETTAVPEIRVQADAIAATIAAQAAAGAPAEVAA